jgi:hypothetical protein
LFLRVRISFFGRLIAPFEGWRLVTLPWHPWTGHAFLYGSFGHCIGHRPSVGQWWCSIEIVEEQNQHVRRKHSSHKQRPDRKDLAHSCGPHFVLELLHSLLDPLYPTLQWDVCRFLTGGQVLHALPRLIPTSTTRFPFEVVHYTPLVRCSSHWQSVTFETWQSQPKPGDSFHFLTFKSLTPSVTFFPTLHFIPVFHLINFHSSDSFFSPFPKRVGLGPKTQPT